MVLLYRNLPSTLGATLYFISMNSVSPMSLWLDPIVSHKTDECVCFVLCPEDREDSFHKHHSPAQGSRRWLLRQQTRLAYHDCLWTSMIHTVETFWTALNSQVAQVEKSTMVLAPRPEPVWLQPRYSGSPLRQCLECMGRISLSHCADHGHSVQRTLRCTSAANGYL